MNKVPIKNYFIEYNSIMDKLKTIQFFILVAQQGNIAKAAKLTDTSPSTISKAIMRLEEELECQLFIRSTRHFKITKAGLNYLDVAKSVISTLELGEAQLRTEKEKPAGILNINLPISYGRLYITPMLEKFCNNYPAINLNIQYNDAYVDMIEQGIDLTIRSGTIQDSRLICQKLSPLSMITCASKKYIDQCGIPETADSTFNHKWIRFRFRQTGDVLPIMFKEKNKIIEIDPDRHFIVDDGESMTELCALNLGLIQVPHFIAKKWLDSKKLIPLSPPITLEKYGVYLLYPRRDYMPARTLAFIDHIKKSLEKINEFTDSTWADEIKPLT